MRYRIVLSYRGAGFFGWQIQDDVPTVQGALEDALKMLLREPVSVTGAGRTDTNVSAVNYVAHFDSGLAISDPAGLTAKMNAVLPRGIVIHSIEPAGDEFHARFDASLRQYKYYIHNFKNCYLDEFSWYCRYKLDVDRMNKACALLLGTHDCSCFEKKGSDNLSSVCEIKSARWEIVAPDSLPPMMAPAEDLGHVLVFTIEANRFLRNMVRAIVGTLVDIGRGVREPEYISALLSGGTRNDAGQSVPGTALFLTRIEYLKNYDANAEGGETVSPRHLRPQDERVSSR